MMVRGMRFCRLCGYRLGEGIEEYAETRRFNTGAPPATLNTAPTFGVPPEWGAITPAPLASTPSHASTPFNKLGRLCRPRRAKWALWIVMAFAILVATGGLSSFLEEGGQRIAPPAISRSYVGADIENAGNGALIESVMPPGSPADLAGLVGGDVITTIDGKRVSSRNDFMEVLGATPVGKTVDVQFLRDGVEKTTKLTTVSRDERKRLADAFAARAEGEGFLGIDPSDLERVFVEQEKVHGIRLGDVMRNRPGYIAGLREGDIVLEFEGVPVRTRSEFLARINRAMPDSIVKMIVMRGGTRLEIPVKMGQD